MDIINYLAIEALEKVGIFKPTEIQITLMERIIQQSLSISVNKMKAIS